MNKKASILDFFLIFAILMLVGISVFVAYIIINTTAGIKVFQDDAIANSAVNTARGTILNFDNMMLFVVIGLSLFVIISSAMVFNHPAMFILSFFLLCIAVFVSAIVSNSFWTFANQSSMISAASNFPKINFLMNKLPIYVAFLGIASIIAMYISYQQQ
jgi:hypothetical protein